jgi:hypothetical protein
MTYHHREKTGIAAIVSDDDDRSRNCLSVGMRDQSFAWKSMHLPDAFSFAVALSEKVPRGRWKNTPRISTYLKRRKNSTQTLKNF